MAVLARDDFFTRLQTMVGTDTSEESLAFIEDMTDTYNDLEQRASGDGVDWEQRYNELDKSWREKYRHRFFSGGGSSYIPPTEPGEDPGPDGAKKDIKIEDLFKKGGK